MPKYFMCQALRLITDLYKINRLRHSRSSQSGKLPNILTIIIL